VLNTGTMYH